MNRTPRLSKSGIEYLDYVWNFESGCTKGCSYCYARKIAKRFPAHYPNGFEPTVYPEALLAPLRLWKASVIGCVFMGDLFDDAINPTLVARAEGELGPAQSLRGRVFTTIENCPRHRFLFLTKQPHNLQKWSPFPDNCWVGVSATDTASYQDACVGLNEVEAKVRFISFEPLLGAIYTEMLNPITPYYNPRGIPFDWVIIGAQTKPTIMPKLEWVEEIVEAADRAGIPVFFKDSLKPLLVDLEHLGFRTLSTVEWAPQISEHLRQEFPKGV